ncbi:MAG: hypothetical protein PHW79_06505 [Candidatus Marinimicrobia bacterium]|nr:hypothetical protein [Candidatus Neomarinimicrobiota bacterium]
METFLEFIGKLVVYGGGAVGLAYGLFIFLGKKWIENKFATRLEEYKLAHDRELEDVRYRINTLFSRVTKIHEKEYEVLPMAWAKLHDGRDHISSLVSPFQQYTDLDRLKEYEIRKILTSYKWDNDHINDLMIAPDKNKYFQEKIFWYRLNEARSKFSDFHIYITRNRIFLSQELKEHFNKADNLLWDSLVMREAGETVKDFKMIYDSYKKIKENIDIVISTIEKLVQERLKYDEAL